MSGLPNTMAITADFPQSVLLRGAALGRFDLLGIDAPETRLGSDFLKSVRDPALAVIAANVGPGRVLSAKLLLSWARIGIVHAVEERSKEYRTVSELIPVYRRVLLIETMPPLAMMWLSFLRERIPATGWTPGRGLL